MSKCFGSVNEGKSHNKSRQSDLALEKFWVTKCGWLQLCTTVAMGVRITNYWKLFRYGVKRDHYNKFIGIREFLEIIDADCFNTPFTTDTGTPEKKIPSLDDIDKKGTVSTYLSLNYYSSSPCNSEISTILDIAIATDPTTSIDHTALK